MAEFHKLDVAAVLSAVRTDKDIGLSEAEAKQRLEKDGPNALPKGGGINWFELILSQFTDPMVGLLIFASGFSAFLGEYVDFFVILIIVILNAILGIYQEFQAEQALAALSAMQVPQVRVRRDGHVKQISAEDLVVGDIVLLEEGDSIPADGRLIESSSMRTIEAALTGESLPIEKNIKTIDAEKVSIGDQHNMVFMGTAISSGRGLMAVTSTALQTELGKIADLLSKVEEGETPLQRRLEQLGRTLFWGALIVVVIVFLVGVFLQGIAPLDMVLVAVSLAVAAVPEGLPALVTIGLSLGAARMVQRNALIRRLPAVETLGSVTVICSDKTGTLTKNEMTATVLALPGHDDVKVSGIGYTPEGKFTQEDGSPIDPKGDPALGRFIQAMALATNAYIEKDNGSYRVVGDTTEGAMLVAAQKVGWTRETLEKEMPRVAELPFNSDRKSMTTVHQVVGNEAKKLFDTTGFISITKGAPDKLIGWATEEHPPTGRMALTEERRARWQQEVDEMAAQGLRVLGVAYRNLEESPKDELDEEIERELVLIGLVGIVDPARPEAKAAVKTAKNAGIRSIMITGDHALTAEAIARDLGIINESQRAVTGKQLDEMTDEQISKVLDETSCFARVSPTHKLKIVQLLQKKDNIAAMTGDGVNDAPALKQADIGVAMGITGTDVSKGAAEMVLTDDNFASIVAAIEEGRAIYDNIRKFIKYLLTSNVGEILVMFVALITGLKLPLLAIQILWINLVTDGLPAIALGFEPAEPDTMQRRPRAKNESIFAGGVGRHILTIGPLLAILTLGGYIYGHTSHGLDLFTDTHGIENFTSAQIEDIIGVGKSYTNEEGEVVPVVPAEWDTLTVEQRMAILVPEHEGEEGGLLEEEAASPLIGYVERVPRTMAFTILAFLQMFEVMAIHGGDRESFFRGFFKSNMLLFWAILSTFVLQLLVIYVPFLQDAFKTAPLSMTDMLISTAIGTIALFAVEIEKWVNRTYFAEHRYVVPEKTAA
jgi:Ca2+-transporting ATPase